MSGIRDQLTPSENTGHTLRDLVLMQLQRLHELELELAQNATALMGRMIKWITVLSGLIALAVVVGVVFLLLVSKPVPDVLVNWGGVIIGFYFGQFVNIVKDYMGLANTASTLRATVSSHLTAARAE